MRYATLQQTLRPGWRGSLFYVVLWGILGVYEPFLNVYFVTLDLSGFEIGVLAAVQPLLLLFYAPPLAAVADRRGWRVRLLTLLSLGTAVSLLLFTFPTTFLTLLPIVVLLALFRSPIVGLADSLVVRMAQRYRLNYGNMRLWGSLSFAIIAIAFGSIWERLGYRLMFVTGGLLFLLVVMAAPLLEERQRMGGQQAGEGGKRPFITLLQSRSLRIFYAITFLMSAPLVLTFFFGGVYMDYLGGGELFVGLIFGVAALAELPTMQYADHLIQRFGSPRTLMLAYGLIIISLLGHVLATTPLQLLAAGAVRGGGFGLFLITTTRFIHEQVSDEWGATAQALFYAGAMGLSPLIASPIGGYIFDALGPRWLFGLCAVVAGCALVALAVAQANGILTKRG